MKIAVIAPVLNEAQFIGYSIMSAWDHVEEFIYAVSPKSDDGTIDILRHIAKKYGKVRILFQSKYDFDPMDINAYDASFNDCIDQAKGMDACWFLHPDMIVTKWQEPKEGPMAWTTKIESYAGDFNTVITKGRASEWKNIHAKKFGLHYYGAYGSVNEDFYHSDITGKSYRHYGSEFSKYPFEITPSGIEVNHYCEVKPYKRRLEKMKLCLKTQAPYANEEAIEEAATQHPRVSLEATNRRFGSFEFEQTNSQAPEVFEKYKQEFEQFQKELVHG